MSLKNVRNDHIFISDRRWQWARV